MNGSVLRGIYLLDRSLKFSYMNETGTLTMVGVHLPGILNEEVRIHLMYMQACFLADRRLAIYTEDRNLGKSRIVQRTGWFDCIVDLVDANA